MSAFFRGVHYSLFEQLEAYAVLSRSVTVSGVPIGADDRR